MLHKGMAVGCEVKVDAKHFGMRNRKYADATCWKRKCRWDAGNQIQFSKS